MLTSIEIRYSLQSQSLSKPNNISPLVFDLDSHLLRCSSSHRPYTVAGLIWDQWLKQASLTITPSLFPKGEEMTATSPNKIGTWANARISVGRYGAFRRREGQMIHFQRPANGSYNPWNPSFERKESTCKHSTGKQN